MQMKDNDPRIAQRGSKQERLLGIVLCIGLLSGASAVRAQDSSAHQLASSAELLGDDDDDDDDDDDNDDDTDDDDTDDDDTDDDDTDDDDSDDEDRDRDGSNTPNGPNTTTPSTPNRPGNPTTPSGPSTPTPSTPTRPSTPTVPSTPTQPPAPSAGRGFPTTGPWVSWYGEAGSTISQTASKFRIINIDADPDSGNFTDAQIATLRANGQNRVLSYLNVGSCESFRSYYSKCEATKALTTPYDGYDDEMWANLSNTDYQDLIVNDIAARLAARGVDGFYLDNLEVVEHGASTNNGPCDGKCAQGGLDLVWKLRQKFPNKLIVMQNATSDVTRLGTTHGVSFPSLLDGVAHEEVYSSGGDGEALAEMKAWRDMKLTVSGHPFWLGVEDYVGTCSAEHKQDADAIYRSAAADGFSAYVTDESAQQGSPCFW